MKEWATADLHFGHSEIIHYCGRPFEICKEMDKALIKNWNDVVKPEDLVYVLGDFAMKRTDIGFVVSRLRQLNGTKILILGNHDYMKPFDYVEAGFQSVHTYLYLPEHDLHLTHDPAIATGYLRKGERWLCGHVHTLFRRIDDVINVGVDVNDFTPVKIDDLLKEFEHEDSNNG